MSSIHLYSFVAYVNSVHNFHDLVKSLGLISKDQSATNSLVIQWLGLRASTAGAWAQFLVGKLRPCMLCCREKKTSICTELGLVKRSQLKEFLYHLQKHRKGSCFVTTRHPITERVTLHQVVLCLHFFFCSKYQFWRLRPNKKILKKEVIVVSYLVISECIVLVVDTTAIKKNVWHPCLFLTLTMRSQNLLYKVPVSRWFSKCGWFWTAAADGSLLEMQILGFHPRPTLSETLAVGPSDLFQHHVQVIFFHISLRNIDVS